jgi:hypothetical protein
MIPLLCRSSSFRLWHLRPCADDADEVLRRRTKPI